MAMAFVPTPAGDRLYLATAKGKSSGPNNIPQRITAGLEKWRPTMRSSTYIATLMYGSLAAIDIRAVEAEMPRYTAEVLTSNRMKAAAETIAFQGGASPIKHVVYIIKENRTYDQIFGDLEQKGRP